MGVTAWHKDKNNKEKLLERGDAEKIISKKGHEKKLGARKGKDGKRIIIKKTSGFIGEKIATTHIYLGSHQPDAVILECHESHVFLCSNLN